MRAGAGWGKGLEKSGGNLNFEGLDAQDFLERIRSLRAEDPARALAALEGEIGARIGGQDRRGHGVCLRRVGALEGPLRPESP